MQELPRADRLGASVARASRGRVPRPSAKPLAGGPGQDARFDTPAHQRVIVGQALVDQSGLGPVHRIHEIERGISGDEPEGGA